MGTFLGPGDLAGLSLMLWVECQSVVLRRRDNRLYVWEFDVLCAGQTWRWKEACEPHGDSGGLRIGRWDQASILQGTACLGSPCLWKAGQGEAPVFKSCQGQGLITRYSSALMPTVSRGLELSAAGGPAKLSLLLPLGPFLFFFLSSFFCWGTRNWT